MNKTLVIGATGKIGSALLQALKETNEPLRAMTRDSEKAAAINAEGTETVVGDLGDPVGLAKALEGIKRVFLVTSPAKDMSQLEKNAITAAQRAGVEYILKISAIGSSLDAPVRLGRSHAQVEDHLKASGIAYTILRPHSFMQNQLGQIGNIRGQGAIYSSMTEGKFPMIDLRDVAAVAARILRNPSPHQGKTYNLTGAKAISFDEMAKIYSEVLGKPVKYVPVPAEAEKAAILSAGLPEWLADDLVTLNSIWRQGYGIAVEPTVEEILGRKPRNFREFVEDHRMLYQD